MTAARRTSPLATVRSAGPLRLALAMLGLLVIAYGGLRLVQDAKDTKPLQLAVSIIGIAVLHDAVIAPLTVAVGWLVTRLVRPRARAYVQGGLAVAGIITLMSLPLIHRQGRSGPGSVLLTQNYTRNLVVLLVLIALVTAGAYALRVRRDQGRRVHRISVGSADHEAAGHEAADRVYGDDGPTASSTNERPPADQSPTA